jgi:hypothetical protein
LHGALISEALAGVGFTAGILVFSFNDSWYRGNTVSVLA